jgi:hypothetical protein
MSILMGVDSSRTKVLHEPGARVYLARIMRQEARDINKSFYAVCSPPHRSRTSPPDDAMKSKSVGL